MIRKGDLVEAHQVRIGMVLVMVVGDSSVAVE